MQVGKNFIAGLTIIGGFALAAPAQAATCTTTSCTGTIKSIVQYNNAQTGAPTQVRLDTDTAPSSCPLNVNKYWIIKPGEENLLKIVLAAYLAGKPVTFRRIEAEATCTIQYVVTDP